MVNAYEGVSRNDITATRHTSRGKEFTLDHPNELILSMKFKGENATGANSQGWQRSCSTYFKQLAKNHPEYFSKKNQVRIQNNHSPKADGQFLSYYPQYAPYKGQTLIHHHIGRDGQAVAIPQGMHNGKGEIHNIEDRLGITQNAKKYSAKCSEYCKKHPDAIGKTSDELNKLMGKKDTHERAAHSNTDSHSNAIQRTKNKASLQANKPQANAIGKAFSNAKGSSPARAKGNAITNSTHRSTLQTKNANVNSRTLQNSRVK